MDSCYKGKVGRSLPGNQGTVLPFKRNSDDQLWPENFGGLYKAPAVDLGSSVSMSVQADDE